MEVTICSKTTQRWSK